MKIKIKSADTTVPDKEIVAASGEEVVVSAGNTISFPEETPVAAVPQGNDLVVFFADGSSIVLEGFFVFGPDEEPAVIDLGEGKSFSADYGFQADDGPIGFLFGIDSEVGYEPFLLSELGAIGGLNGLVTLGIADYFELSILGDRLLDVGQVLEIPIPATISTDDGTISGSGVVSGTESSEIVIATSDSGNILSAFGGDDTLVVSRVGDALYNTLLGGLGNDSLLVESQNEDVDYNYLSGDVGNDTLVALALDPGNGTDAPDGDVRSNTLLGGAGDDSLYLESSDDMSRNLIDVDSGRDTVVLFSRDDAALNSVFGGDGYDSLRVRTVEVAEMNTLSGGAGSDTLAVVANLQARFNQFFGGDDADSLYAASSVNVEDNIFDGGAGGDVFFSYSRVNMLSNSLFGGAGTDNDSLFLSAGVDILGNTLDGALGDDSIIVGQDAFLSAGNSLDAALFGANEDITGNSLFGGLGVHRDTLFVWAGDDAGLNTLRGEDGVDILRVEAVDDVSMNQLFGGDDGDILIAIAQVRDDLRTLAGGNPRLSTVVSGDSTFNTLDGGEGGDFIEVSTTQGTVFSNSVFGGSGAFGDTLLALAGADASLNTLDGGGGADSLMVDSAGNSTGNSLLGGDGMDTLVASTTGDDGDLRSNVLRGGAGDDSLDVEVQGTLADIESNTIVGDGGDDTLSVKAVSLANQNWLFGDDEAGVSTGNDTLAISGAGLLIYNTLEGGDGNDSLFVSSSANNVAINSLAGDSGYGHDTLVVSAFADDKSVYGNNLVGGAGQDSLLAMSSGARSLFEGNTLEGGDGHDTLVLDVTGSQSQVLINSLLGGDGDDVLRFRVNTVDQSIQATIDDNTFDGGANSPGGGAGAGDTLHILADGEMNNSGGITNIEVLDFTNGETNLIELDTLAVASIVGVEDSLTIHGDGPGDSVTIDPAQWTGPTPDGNFNVFASADLSSGIRLLVQNDLTIVAPVPIPFAGDADDGSEVEALYGGDLVPDLEIDFDALAWRDGSLSGGEATGSGSLEGGEREILVGVEDVLDFSRTEYAIAFAAIEAGGWEGGENPTAAGVAGAFALGVPEIALTPGAGVSSLLDLDAPPADGIEVV